MIQKNYATQKLSLKHVQYESLIQCDDIHPKLREVEELIKKKQASKVIVADECVYSCTTIDDIKGLYINLTTMNAVGHAFLTIDTLLTGCQFYLNVRRVWNPVKNHTRIEPQISTCYNDTPCLEVSRLKWGYAYKICFFLTKQEMLVYSVHPSTLVVNDTNLNKFLSEYFYEYPNIANVVRDIQNSLDKHVLRGIVTSEAVLSNCQEVQNLKQIEHPPQLDYENLRCAECNRKTNLWLHLYDGYVGCGRKIYGVEDSGCLDGKEGAAVEHFEKNKNTCTVAVKLGTLSATSAEVYCYVDDAIVNDPLIQKHLSHFHLTLENQCQSEKSISQLELEMNRDYNWKPSSEEDETIQNLGFVGLKNYGNSCYMNVILQLLSRVFELRDVLNPDNFLRELWEVHAQLKSKYIPETDVLLQLGKVLRGLTSKDIAESRDALLKSLNESQKTAYKNEFPNLILYPYLFYQTSIQNHREFGLSSQQDAEEYLRYILDVIQTMSLNHPLKCAQDVYNVVQENFCFTIEEQLRSCQDPSLVRLSTVNEMILCLPLHTLYTKKKSKALEADKLYEHQDKEEFLCFEDGFLSWMQGESVTLHCDHNGSREFVDAQKTRKIKTFPHYLIIQLGRVFLSEDYSIQKIQDSFKMPMDLDLSQYKATGLSADDVVWSSDDEVIPSDSLKKSRATDNEIIVENIIKMGFSQNAARNALNALNSDATVEQCVEWILKNSNLIDINQCRMTKKRELSPVQFTSDLLTSMGFSNLQIQVSMSLHNGDEQQALEWLMTVGSFLTDEELQQNLSISLDSPPITKNSLTCLQKNISLPSNKCTGKYRLVGACCHKGNNANSGHFTFCTFDSQASGNPTAACLNDQTITKCSFTCLLKGYLYLYKQCDD